MSGIDGDQLEIRKECVHQNKDSKKCAVVHAIVRNSEEVDYELMRGFREN